MRGKVVFLIALAWGLQAGAVAHAGDPGLAGWEKGGA
jgi:hypothetical protein